MEPILFLFFAFIGAGASAMAILVGAGMILDAFRNRHASRRVPPFE